MVCVLTFIGWATLLHMKLLSVMLSKTSFMVVLYFSVGAFVVGLALIPIGALYTPEMLFASELLISAAGAQVYVMQFCLWSSFNSFAVLSACAFAVSTTMIQIVDIPCPIYVPFSVWIGLLVIVTICYKPIMPSIVMAPSSKMDNFVKVLHMKELYVTYTGLLFGLLAKCYYA